MDETPLLKLLREVCLSLPEVRETVKWGHPTFEAGTKMFAVLDMYEGRPYVAFRAVPEKCEQLLKNERFFEAPYAARYGWLCLRADRPIDRTEIQQLVRDSYRLVALKRMLAALSEQGTASLSTKARPRRPRS